MKKFIILTTISPPNDEMLEWFSRFPEWHIVIVGDLKTHDESWKNAPVEYLSIARQDELFPELSRCAPRNHYCRKNIGYLYAINQNAELIWETDDDTFPYTDAFSNLKSHVTGRLVGEKDWINVYRYFTDTGIWPRGLPLDETTETGTVLDKDHVRDCPIQQFLVDEDPDVDAIWRLLNPEARVSFDPCAEPVILDQGSMVPFNSQNTVFYPSAYPLLYLPHYANFRMTDIWRSFVAQVCLWIQDHNLAFHTASAVQKRNPHDLLADFKDEVPGYLHNREIGHFLKEKSLKQTVSGTDVQECARELWLGMIGQGFLPEKERPLIDAWFDSF